MLVQSYRLPLRAGVSWADIFEAHNRWLSRRHRDPIQLDEIADPETGDNFEYKTEGGNCEVQIRRYLNDGEEISAIRITIYEPTATWKTDCILQIGNGVSQLFIQTHYERSHADNYLPFVNKPAVLRQIIDMGLCADDDGMNISSTTIWATDKNWDLRVDIMNGDRNNVLPVVYLTREEDNTLPLDLNTKYLAKRLAGIAHVIEEREYHHSSLMDIPTCGNNVHSGYIGLYFPGTGRMQRYRPWDFAHRDELMEVLLNDVRLAWLNRVDANFCTWETIRSMQLHKKLDDWRLSSDKDNAELAEFMAFFEQENRELREKNEELSRQVYALKAKQDAQSYRAVPSAGSFYNSGNEPEFYPGEKNDLLHSLLSQALSRTNPDSRQNHLIQSLLDANPRVGEGQHILNDIANVISRGNLSPADISELETLGFSAVRGNHMKLCFHDDLRYRFVVACTPSDYRAIKNSISDINSKLNVERKIF